MEYKNYCLVGLGTIDGMKDDIIKVSEFSPRLIEQKKVIIATFSSVMEPSELRDFFDNPERIFFIFEVNDESAAYFIGRPEIQKQLFGHIENGGEKVLDIMNQKLMVLV
jgi:hypothetical protein